MGNKGSRGNSWEKEIWELMEEYTIRVKRSKGSIGEVGKYKVLGDGKMKGKRRRQTKERVHSPNAK